MKRYTIIILLLSTLVSNGQEVLTMKKAMSQALLKNNNIQISKNNTEIAKSQNTIGNAGYLPSLTFNSNTSYGNTNSTQQFLSQPDPIKFTGAQSLGYGANVALNYTIFGGLGTFYTHKKLKFSEKSSEMQERLQVEAIILQTIQSFSQALQGQNNLNILKETMNISRERYRRSQIKFEMASINSIELLNAKVDFNTDSINYINASANFENAKYSLNQLLNSDEPTTDYTLEDDFEIDENLLKEDILKTAKENNSAILNASYGLDLTEADSKIAKSTLMPRLSLNSTYSFNHNENDASFVIYTESSGLSGTLQLSIPIFDGHKKTIQYKSSKIKVDNAKLQLKEEESKLERDINIAFQNYKKTKIISQMDETNVEAASLNFEKSKDLFQSGQLTGTQYREAQLNLRRIKLQMNNNRINFKLAEIELIRLSGQLIN